MITPDDESITKLLEDYQSDADSQYGIVHILFTN